MPLVKANRRGMAKAKFSSTQTPTIRQRKQDPLKALKPFGRELKSMGKEIWYGNKKRRK